MLPHEKKAEQRKLKRTHSQLKKASAPVGRALWDFGMKTLPHPLGTLHSDAGLGRHTYPTNTVQAHTSYPDDVVVKLSETELDRGTALPARNLLAAMTTEVLLFIAYGLYHSACAASNAFNQAVHKAVLRRTITEQEEIIGNNNELGRAVIIPLWHKMRKEAMMDHLALENEEESRYVTTCKHDVQVYVDKIPSHVPLDFATAHAGVRNGDLNGQSEFETTRLAMMSFCLKACDEIDAKEIAHAQFFYKRLRVAMDEVNQILITTPESYESLLTYRTFYKGRKNNEIVFPLGFEEPVTIRHEVEIKDGDGSMNQTGRILRAGHQWKTNIEDAFNASTSPYIVPPTMIFKVAFAHLVIALQAYLVNFFTQNMRFCPLYWDNMAGHRSATIPEEPAGKPPFVLYDQDPFNLFYPACQCFGIMKRYIRLLRSCVVRDSFSEKLLESNPEESGRMLTDLENRAMDDFCSVMGTPAMFDYWDYLAPDKMESKAKFLKLAKEGEGKKTMFCPRALSLYFINSLHAFFAYMVIGLLENYGISREEEKELLAASFFRKFERFYYLMECLENIEEAKQEEITGHELAARLEKENTEGVEMSFSPSMEAFEVFDLSHASRREMTLNRLQMHLMSMLGGRQCVVSNQKRAATLARISISETEFIDWNVILPDMALFPDASREALRRISLVEGLPEKTVAKAMTMAAEHLKNRSADGSDDEAYKDLLFMARAHDLREKEAYYSPKKTPSVCTAEPLTHALARNLNLPHSLEEDRYLIINARTFELAPNGGTVQFNLLYAVQAGPDHIVEITGLKNDTINRLLSLTLPPDAAIRRAVDTLSDEELKRLAEDELAFKKLLLGRDSLLKKPFEVGQAQDKQDNIRPILETSEPKEDGEMIDLGMNHNEVSETRNMFVVDPRLYADYAKTLLATKLGLVQKVEEMCMSAEQMTGPQFQPERRTFNEFDTPASRYMRHKLAKKESETNPAVWTYENAVPITTGFSSFFDGGIEANTTEAAMKNKAREEAAKTASTTDSGRVIIRNLSTSTLLVPRGMPVAEIRVLSRPDPTMAMETAKTLDKLARVASGRSLGTAAIGGYVTSSINLVKSSGLAVREERCEVLETSNPDKPKLPDEYRKSGVLAQILEGGLITNYTGLPAGQGSIETVYSGGLDLEKMYSKEGYMSRIHGRIGGHDSGFAEDKQFSFLPACWALYQRIVENVARDD